MIDRLNARVSPDVANRVLLLRERTGKSTTEVIAASIEHYYERVLSEQNPKEPLGEFVGCAKGASELASNYKQHLTDSLSRKASK